MVSLKNRRRFYRHPLEMPIQVTEETKKEVALTPNHHTVDFSAGGICFLCDHSIEKGTTIRLSIPTHERLFQIKALIAYSKKDSKIGMHRIGVTFDNANDLFQAKMAEEILSIQKFREELSSLRGQEITEEEAANEWIAKNAKKFASYFQD